MAEGSAYWEGVTTGDAGTSAVWDAPYTHSEWSSIKNYLLANSGEGGFVLPGYNNNLVVLASAPGAMTVEVGSGAMFSQGRIYENTTTLVLNIAANTSGYNRIDRIVVRTTFASQTIRTVVIEGTPAVVPALPALVDSITYYDVPLAYVWVDNAAVAIADTAIHDERLFASNHLSLNSYYDKSNLLKNSEFMAFSQLNGGATTNPPECWDLVGTPSDIASYSRPYQMSRGRAVQVTADGASEGISQTVTVKPSTPYAIRLLTRGTSGDVGLISVTTNSGAPGTISRYTRRSDSWVEETLVYITEADASTLTVSLLALNSGDIIRYGQVILVEGYISGPYRKCHEKIEFTEAVTDFFWTVSTRANYIYTVDLTTEFQGIILENTKGILVQLSGYDAVAADSTIYVGLGQATVSTANVAENITLYSTAWVGLQTNDVSDYHTFYVFSYSNPVSSFRITIKILGIVI
jgi:hypothetical protein